MWWKPIARLHSHDFLMEEVYIGGGTSSTFVFEALPQWCQELATVVASTTSFTLTDQQSLSPQVLSKHFIHPGLLNLIKKPMLTFTYSILWPDQMNINAGSGVGARITRTQGPQHQRSPLASHTRSRLLHVGLGAILKRCVRNL